MKPNPSAELSRRRFLQTSALASAGALLHSRARAEEAPMMKVTETKVISLDPQYYHGWPTLARRKNGQFVVTYSGGREDHVCPFGRVEMIVSNDNGATWGFPRVLLDGDIDDRDSGVLETSRGTLLVTTFTSLAYEKVLQTAEKKKADEPGAWPAERLKLWRAAHNRLTAEQRNAQLGQWMIRSTDGGITWSPRYSSVVNSPHGPIELADGRLIYAGKELWTGERRVGVCESIDDGRSWRWLATITPRVNDDPANYHELHAVETNGGRIIVHVRNHNKANVGETLQSESTDGGKTWSVPQAIGVWGLPSHLLRLRSGNLLMTYGHRRKPFGNQARLSKDSGRTWSEPMTISGDGLGVDLGYPSTAELDDGSFITVWYERMKDSPRAVLRAAKWVMEV
ncbi:MAG: exo-alpha-sialidase [Verrucomicrobia bacterium]|nr:exo-alpha-sialidase [Verrucomicrobiota bacterium]